MGWLGNMFDDVLDLPAKVIETPAKVARRLLCLGEHRWGPWEPVAGMGDMRECEECSASERR